MEVGLVDWTGGFLTGERFGGGVDVSGTALGWKQTWLLEAVPEAAGPGAGPPRWWACLRGPGGRPLVAEAGGAVRTSPLPGEGTLFVVEAHASGAWSLCEAGEGEGGGGGGRFLESDGEDVFCVACPPSPRGLWLPRLAAPALACLFHPPRGRYARADPELCRVWVDADEPEGPQCGFLVRRARGGACVHLEACRRRFVSREGRLASQPSSKTALLLRLRPGGWAALSDQRGRPLFPQGPRGLLRPADPDDAVGEGGEEQEWFQVQRLPPRVALRSPAAARFLSVLQGGDVYAGSRNATPLGSFLLEADLDGETLRLRGPHQKYLAQRGSGAVRADGEARDPATLFRALWLCGTVFLRAADGRFLGTGPRGRVRATAAEPGPREEFWLRLADRPFVVLRGARGFVGSRGPPSPPSSPPKRGLLLPPLRGDLLEPDVVELLPCARGVYHLRSRGKGFWGLGAEGALFCGGRAALNFCLELRGPHRLALLAPNGLYVRGDHRGALCADAHDPHQCLWEF
ncbi:fascin-3 [Anolis carolinensis]|uniref:fascin-3 n=1 Tax=Anolis carolinensis TaxID=28377 RepID=UPI002F2B79EA